MSEIKAFEFEDLNFEIMETEETSFTSGESGFVFYIKMFNKGNNSKKVEINSVSYVNNYHEQFEFDSFLNGHFSREGSIKSDSFKRAGMIFYNSKVPKINDNDSLYFEITDSKRGKKYHIKFIAKVLKTKTKWIAVDCEVIESEKKLLPSEIRTYLKKNLQRMEMLEEKFGIYLDNISVQVSKDDYRLSVKGEIFVISGSTIEESIDLSINLYDVEGDVLDTSTVSFRKDELFGFDVFEFNFYKDNIALDAKKLRIYPKKY